MEEVDKNTYIDNQDLIDSKGFEPLNTVESFVQMSNDIFIILNSDYQIKYVSDTIEQVLDFRPKDLLGSQIGDIFNNSNQKKLNSMIGQTNQLSSSEVRANISIKTKNNNKVYFECVIKNLLSTSLINGIVISLRDITSKIRMEKEVSHLTYHDEVTGLPNRVLFRKLLESRFNYSYNSRKALSVMMIDLDEIKNVVYSLGYDIGEKLVIKIVERIRIYLKEKFVLSRYSQDHLSILFMEKISYKKYVSIAEDIINLFTKPFIVDSYKLDVSVNLGIATFNDEMADIYSLKNKALLALLWAKRKGKNTYHFYLTSQNTQKNRELSLRKDLPYAIERKQLEVYYQPIINLSNNEILGAEALIRWNHPEWGMILPSEFIHIAEESKLIIEIGKWVLQDVCRNHRKRHNQNLPKIKISVNFSTVQLLEYNLVEKITELIDSFSLSYDFLVIELTESVLIKESEKVTSDLNKLKSLGIQIALDDFGRGFSSLFILESFDIDIIKIDKSFVKGILSNHTKKTIVNLIINLAEKLGIHIVAEGIETQEQLDSLKELNCNVGQGYLFSKPLSTKNFENLLADGICLKPLKMNI